jgi:predicted MFS family arabinose efflux permease
VRSRSARLLPLVLATMATQASIVTLAPIVAEIADDLNVSISAIGVGRSALAGTAVAASLAIGPMIDRIGVRPLIMAGGGLALAGAAATAAAPSLPFFYAAHVITGGGVACLLSAGFAGVASYFEEGDAEWAMGYVVGAQSLAWIVGNPIIGVLADSVSWRASYAVPALAALLALLAGFAAPRTRPATPVTGRTGLGVVLRERSARRWAIAELVAYAAWTADLTYVGAFYVHSYGVEESVVGLLLAIGSLCFLAATLSTARLTERIPRKPMIVASALGMGVLLVPLLNLTPSLWFTVAIFCPMAVFAGLRSTGASSLGLAQLPSQAGSMMGARTASAQLGYMIGAALGAAVLALSDFGTLGFVLFAGMAASALLIAGVRDPHEVPTTRVVPQPVPD